jgi:iron complex transport system ATP-binding protein
MLSADRASVARGGRRVLADVSVTVRPGALTALVGPNGAGKSSLLALLAGRLRPYAGRVTLDGQCLSLWDHPGLARRRAVLSQNVQLAFGFSALEVVLLGRCPHHRGVERASDRAVALEALRAVGALALHDRSLLELSGGEQQRVQLARVLAQVWERGDRPAYLLLDEPEAGLDVAHQHFVLGLARRLAGEGLGVLAVLHDLNLAARYADDVALMFEGRVLRQGTPEAVLDPEPLSAAYGLRLKRSAVPDAPRGWMIVH